MNEINEHLELAVRSACTRHVGRTAARAGGFNSGLWSALDQIGVTSLTVPEHLGGSDGDLLAAVTVLEVLGEHSSSVPLAETLLAGHLLAVAEASIPEGPMAVAVWPDSTETTDGPDGALLVGDLGPVSWARDIAHLVLLHRNLVMVVPRTDLQVTQRVNLAGEPRDHVSVRSVVPNSCIRAVDETAAVLLGQLRARAAVTRAALMVGAGRRALELSMTYAADRSQFGRPIAKFQAVQQHLAAMATEVLLSKVSVEAAAVAIDSGGDIATAAAAAKTVAGQMAGVVASLSHQIHGAIGYTDEHPLSQSTKRLWAWRDEDGDETSWSVRLGRSAVAGGTAGLWPLVTSTTERTVR